jgi:hypothetical protein
MQVNSPFLEILISSFLGTATSALAELLYSKRRLDARIILATFLFGGMFGLGIALFWWNYMREETPGGFVIGVSILAGLGGITFMQIVVRIVGRVIFDPIGMLVKHLDVPLWDSNHDNS